MSSLDYDGTPEQPQGPGWGKGPVIVLTAGLVLALAGDGYLLKRSNDADDQMARIQADTHTQITTLGDSTTAMLQQRLQALDEEMTAAVKGANTATTAALKRAQAEASKQSQALAKRLQEQQQQQQQVAAQLGDLKEATNSVDSKVSAVSSDVGM